MPAVKVNDINVYYEIHGEGEPLIVIGALGSDISNTKTDTEVFQKYQVLLFDNRGAGRTDKPDALYSID